jgi:hypothetical protein
MMLVFVHVMVHPWVHTIGVTATSHDRASATRAGSVTAGDQCELCRIGHSVTASPRLPQTDLLNPLWIRTALQAVNYNSLQAGRRLPSRAPPIV